MKLHILTITHNGDYFLNPLAESLFKCKLPDVNWHIRDNASNDNTEDIIKNLKSTFPIHYYKINHNKDNYAACHNFLIEKIKEDDCWLLFLNNDIVINDPNSIKNMIELIDDNVGVVGAKLLYPDKTIQHGGVIFPREYGGLPKHYNIGKKNSNKLCKNGEFQAVTFAFALVRKSCILNLKNGKLDEGYHWCFDDITTCLDIKYRQNMKIMYCGKTNITHLESATLKKNNVNKLYQKYNFSRFRQEWGRIVELY
jgi:GT2 family glycosyltransferase